MEDSEKEAINWTKQSIAPTGLGDRFDKATTLLGNESPDDSPLEDMNSHLADDDQDDVRLTINTG